MEDLPGAFGTSASFALRFGQTVFSSASLLFMCFHVDFYSYTAFCLSRPGYHPCICLAWGILTFVFVHAVSSYLVTVMGLVIPWSITLFVIDAYSVFIKYIPAQRRLMLIIILGDMVLSYLTLAAACSTASVTDLLLEAHEPRCQAKLCGRYQLSAAMAFLAWFLSSASCLFNFWLFPSL